MFLSEDLQKKWQPVLEHPELDTIKDSHRRAVTATLLENQERAAREGAGGSGGYSEPSLLRPSSSSVASAVDIFVQFARSSFHA
jgi:hypothetical protein